jgi:hypothetical protein
MASKKMNQQSEGGNGGNGFKTDDMVTTPK